MIKVIAQQFIKPEHMETVAPLYRQIVEETIKEPGCISYVLHQDINDPTHFVFIEEWKDQAALDIHMNSPHYTTIIPQIKGYSAQPTVATLLKVF